MSQDHDGTATFDLSVFPPVATSTWDEVIRKDLKGADYDKRLVWRTDEGLTVRPFYRQEDLAALGGQLGRSARGLPLRARHARRRLGGARDPRPGTRRDSRRPAARCGRDRRPAVGVRPRRGRRAHRARHGHGPARRGRRPRHGVRVRGRLQLLPGDREAPCGSPRLGARPGGIRRLRHRRAAPDADAGTHRAHEQERVRRLHQPAARHDGSHVGRPRRLPTARCRARGIRGAPRHRRPARARARKRTSARSTTRPVARTTSKRSRTRWPGRPGRCSRRSRPPAATPRSWPPARWRAAVERSRSGTREGRRVTPADARRREQLPQRRWNRRRPSGRCLRRRTAWCPAWRMSGAFERMRRRTEQHAGVAGRVPSVLLLTRGDLKMRTARANFSRNFFGCAGFGDR